MMVYKHEEEGGPTCVCAHVSLEQWGSVERLAAHFAREQRSLAPRRAGLRRRLEEGGAGVVAQRVQQITGWGRSRGQWLSGYRLALVSVASAGRRWRIRDEHTRQERHGQVERRVCNRVRQPALCDVSWSFQVYLPLFMLSVILSLSLLFFILCFTCHCVLR